ncbi:lysophospholipid acyltransferase LPEAT1-like [Impatiens glandulifera]|uniref:lysophospholipid acyltransferase LPEAT1-like n=1 Tax=Impatiens glandulifera TaxID=253017 RepID=UPI001FB12A4A|nr:lysophospholipid acyltransferase LPEAT1-like [Impatiens glandulifera]
MLYGLIEMKTTVRSLNLTAIRNLRTLRHRLPRLSRSWRRNLLLMYVQNDVYGTMGLGELPLTEKILIGVVLVTLLMLIVYYVICRICTMFSSPNRADEHEDYAHMCGWRRAVIIRSEKFLSRAILFAMGFYWNKEIPLHQEVYILRWF